MASHSFNEWKESEYGARYKAANKKQKPSSAESRKYNAGMKQQYRTSLYMNKQYGHSKVRAIINGYPYIHYHADQIGTAIGANKNGINQLFTKQHKDQIVKASTEQYKKLLIQNLTLTEEEKGALQNISNINDDIFIKELNEAVTDLLEKRYSKENTEKINEIIKNRTGRTIESFLKKTGAVKETTIKGTKSKIGEGKINDIQAFKTIFIIFARIMKELGQKDMQNAFTLLIKKMQKNSIKEGSETSALANLIKEIQNTDEGKILKVSEDVNDKLKNFKTHFENLVVALQKNEFKTTKNSVTNKGLARLISNVMISTDLMQNLGLINSLKTQGIVQQGIRDIFKNENNNVGKNKLEVTVHSDWDDEDIKSMVTRKTDIQTQMDLGIIDFKSHILINPTNTTFIAGISQKFYTSIEKIYNEGNFLTGVISSGSGGSLREAINAVWPNNIDRYYAYNIFVHNQNIPAFNNFIIKRNFLRLFSTMGNNKDFASFLMVNGEIFSIYEILKIILDEKNNFYASKSQSNPQEDNQIVYLSIPAKKAISNQNKLYWDGNENTKNRYQGYMRSIKINGEITSARIYAYLHLDNLKKQLPRYIKK